VSNGVLLVDFANVLRSRGKPILEATIEAGKTGDVLRLDIANNNADGLGGNQDYLVRQRDTSTFSIERLTGSGTDDTNIQNFISGQNSPAGQTVRATHATTFTAIADGTVQNPGLPLAAANGQGPGVRLRSGHQASFTGGTSLEHQVASAPDLDGFDDWCRVRDNREDHARSYQYVSADVVGADDEAVVAAGVATSECVAAQARRARRREAKRVERVALDVAQLHGVSRPRRGRDGVPERGLGGARIKSEPFGHERFGIRKV
jgi:hypothetical protein